MELCPIRLRHLQPRAESCEAPFEQPIRLFFFGRDEADRVLVEAGRSFVGFDIGHKAVFVALLGERPDGLEGVCRGGHAEYLGSSCSGEVVRVGVRGTKAAGVTIASSETAANACPTARLIAA